MQHATCNTHTKRLVSYRIVSDLSYSLVNILQMTVSLFNSQVQMHTIIFKILFHIAAAVAAAAVINIHYLISVFPVRPHSQSVFIEQ